MAYLVALEYPLNAYNLLFIDPPKYERLRNHELRNS